MTKGFLKWGSTRVSPEAEAISIIATPSGVMLYCVEMGRIRGSVVSHSTTLLSMAEQMAAVVPSPPSAIANCAILHCGISPSIACRATSANSVDDAEPLNESKASTILLILGIILVYLIDLVSFINFWASATGFL